MVGKSFASYYYYRAFVYYAIFMATYKCFDAMNAKACARRMKKNFLHVNI